MVKACMKLGSESVSGVVVLLPLGADCGVSGWRGLPLVCAWWEAGDDDGEEGGVVIGVLDDGEVLGENDAGAGAAALGDAEGDGVGEPAMPAVVVGELKGVDEAVIEADKDGDPVGLVVPELDAVMVGVCEPVGETTGLCEALGVADGVADGDSVADGVVVGDGVCVGVPVLELDAVRVGETVPELVAVLVGVCEPVGVTAGLCEALGVADGVADGDSVADGVVVGDGDGVGDGVCVGDGVGVGDAMATHSAGKQTMSTTAGQLAPVQFHTPYSVLPTHDPSPEHDRLHWPGAAGRVQNMLVFVHEWLPEQVTAAPSCRTMEVFPDAAEQLSNSWQLSEE